MFGLPRLPRSFALFALAMPPDDVSEVHDADVIDIGEPAVRLNHQHLAVMLRLWCRWWVGQAIA
jgi:hypothetical protein